MITMRSSGKSSISRGPTSMPVGDLDVPERAADADVLAHRAPDQRDLAIERGGGVDDLLDAVDVRGEAGHDDPSLGSAAKTSSRCGPTTDSDGEKPGAVGVGRVAAEQQHALAAELGQARDVGRRRRRPASGRTCSRR